MKPLILTACTAFALAPFSLAQTVHVVDDDGGAGVHYSSLSAAVSGAASGDLILVRSGSYGGFTINGKALTIVEDTGQSVSTGAVTVRNLAAGQSVELIGIAVENPGAGAGLKLVNNAGSIEVDGASVRSTEDFYSAVEIESSDAVTLSGCTIDAAPAADGLTASGSAVHLYGCTVQGGEGLALVLQVDGGAGVSVRDGFLFAAGSAFRAGDGGAGVDSGSLLGCYHATDGGAGLSLGDGDPQVLLRDCTITAGVAGDKGCGSAASDGEAQVVVTGTITELAGPARGYSLPPVAREGEVATITFEGEAGEICFWIASVATAPAFLPLTAGTVVPAVDGIVNMGVLPESGTLSVPFVIPTLPIPYLRLYEQPIYFGSDFGFVAGDPLVSILVQAGL